MSDPSPLLVPGEKRFQDELRVRIAPEDLEQGRSGPVSFAPCQTRPHSSSLGFAKVATGTGKSLSSHGERQGNSKITI